MEYALTKEIKEQLRAIAEKLHKLPEWTKKYKEVDGAYLLKQGYKSIKKNNETLFVIAGKKYTVPDGYIDTSAVSDSQETAARQPQIPVCSCTRSAPACCRLLTTSSVLFNGFMLS